MTIIIDEDEISDSAKDLVRANFNPSELSEVDKVKLVTAYLIAQCEKLREVPGQGRHASLAITAYEEASMWAVKSITTPS